MKKKATLVLLALALCVVLTACVGEKATKSEFFSYVVDMDNHVVITGYSGNELSVVIPSKIDGKTVTGIAEEAFKPNNLVVKVKIPSTVTYIGEYAFQKCEKREGLYTTDTCHDGNNPRCPSTGGGDFAVERTTALRSLQGHSVCNL